MVITNYALIRPAISLDQQAGESMDGIHIEDSRKDAALSDDAADGLSEVVFEKEKQTSQTSGTIEAETGWLAEYNGTPLDGYEIHAGRNQYGPFRMGPAYPYNFGGKHISNKEFPCPPYASFGVSIARLNYLDKSCLHPDLGEVEKLDVPRMNKELELLEDMRVALGKGADIFDSITASLPPSRAEKARRMAGLGRYMQRTVITAINVKRGAIAHRAGDKAAVLELARKEYANAKAALPLAEADSRLGWEPSMEYVGGPEQIRWKLGRMEQTYGKDSLR